MIREASQTYLVKATEGSQQSYSPFQNCDIGGNNPKKTLDANPDEVL